MNLGTKNVIPVGTTLILTAKPDTKHVFADEVRVEFVTNTYSMWSQKTITIEFRKWGHAKGRLAFDSDAEGYNAKIYVYDKQSNQIVFNKVFRRDWFSETEFETPALVDGDYTLLGVIHDKFTNAFTNEQELLDLGFEPGLDYVKKEFTVRTGEITDLGEVHIPYVDLMARNDLFGGDGEFSWLPKDCMVNLDSDVLVKLRYKVAEFYRDKEGTIKISVNLPPGVKMKTYSIGTDYIVTHPYMDIYDEKGVKAPNIGGGGLDGKWFIESHVPSGTLYFTVSKTTYGTGNISATATYTFEDQSSVASSLGGIAPTVDPDTLGVKGRSDCLKRKDNDFWLYVTPNAQVQLYVDGAKKGGAQIANSVGGVYFRFDMDYEPDDAYHEIYAEITTVSGVVQSRSDYLLYPAHGKIAWLKSLEIEFEDVAPWDKFLLDPQGRPRTSYLVFRQDHIFQVPSFYAFTAEFENADYVYEDSVTLWAGLDDSTWDAVKLYRVGESNIFVGDLSLSERASVSSWTMEFATKPPTHEITLQVEDETIVWLTDWVAQGHKDQLDAWLADLEKEEVGDDTVFDMENLFAKFSTSNGSGKNLQSSDSPEFATYSKEDQEMVLRYEAKAQEFRQQTLSYVEAYARAFVDPKFEFSSDAPTDEEIDAALGITNIGFTRTEDLEAYHSNKTGRVYKEIEDYPTNTPVQEGLQIMSMSSLDSMFMASGDDQEHTWTKPIPEGMTPVRWDYKNIRDGWFEQQGYKIYGDGTAVDYYVYSKTNEWNDGQGNYGVDEILYYYAYDTQNPEKSSDGVTCTTWTRNFDNPVDQQNYIKQKKGEDTPEGRKVVGDQEEKATQARREVDWWLETLTGTLTELQEPMDWSESAYFNFLEFFIPNAVRSSFEVGRFREKNKVLEEMKDWISERSVKGGCDQASFDYGWEVIFKAQAYNNLRMGSATLLAAAGTASFVKDTLSNLATKAKRISLGLDYAKQLADQAAGFDVSLDVQAMIEDSIKDAAFDAINSVLSANEKMMDGIVTNALRAFYSTCKQKDDPESKSVPKPDPKPEFVRKVTNVKAIYDPSGYVYEAVPSNRLDGVEATIYYKDEENRVKWIAEDYDQINDQITGDTGDYGWMVPEGEWLVEFKKAGYDDAFSAIHKNAAEVGGARTEGWLPVPPIQLGINIPMKAQAKPEVSYVHAYPDYVQVGFTQYMDISTLTTDEVTLEQGGESVSVVLAYPDKEEDSEYSSGPYARTLRITPENGNLASGDVTLSIANAATSYNGETLDTYTQTAAITTKPSFLSLSAWEITLNMGETVTVTVTVLDELGEPMGGVKVLGKSSTTRFATVTGDRETDNQGKAIFAVTGVLPGSAVLTFQIENTDIKETADVKINNVGIKKPATPVANLRDGARVAKGTKLTLTCATKGAAIYYTTNGQCPCDDNTTRYIYKEPITIVGDTHFRVRALLDGVYSDGLSFTIYVQEETPGVIQPPKQSEDLVPEPGTQANVAGKADIEGSKAVLSLDLDKLGELDTQDSGSEELVVDLTQLKQNLNAAQFSHKDLSALAQVIESGAFTSLTVKLDSGELNLDAATVAAVKEIGSGMTVRVVEVDHAGLEEAQKSLVGDRPIVDITISAGDKNIADLQGGKVTVKLPYSLKPGENPDYIVVWHLNNAGELESYSCTYQDGYIRFVLDHLSQYIVSYFPFRDVEAGVWYYGNVAFVYQSKLMVGVGDELFGPEIATNRAMLVTILHRVEGSPGVGSSEAFADVEEGSWYCDAVSWAKEKGIVEGIGDNLFDPQGRLTREQLATILYRYANYKDPKAGEPKTHLESYGDWLEVSDWAYEAMEWSVAKDIIRGVGNNLLSPGGEAQRSQMAAVLERYLSP